MKSEKIRQKFLEYFKDHDHEIVKSSSLLPVGDATLLFTNAGMVPFKSVFLGDEKRDYSRAASCQKCVRAGGKHNDLENVGYTARHHTFFEMLGNFSFGDYFKEDAIKYGWEFLTDVLKLPKDKLWISIYTDDDEAYDIWSKVDGIDTNKIVRLGEADNFWSMGDTGPCGPCSEIHIDQGDIFNCSNPKCAVGCDCGRYLEIWNLVFMQYNRDDKGKLTPLPKPSIDTGMGLERLAAVMQGKLTNYDTDIFAPLIKTITELAGVTYGKDNEKDVSIKAIIDHSRSAAFMIADGILPSNVGRGYVLRRIIRRAVRHGKMIGLTEPFLFKVCQTVIDDMGSYYKELKKEEAIIIKAVSTEEVRFLETLEKGLAILEEEIKKLKKENKKVIAGTTVFKLYDTFGFPVDLIQDIIRNTDFTIDEDGFNIAMERQKTVARQSWKGSGEATSDDLYKELSLKGIGTEFTGYSELTSKSKITAIIKDGALVDECAEGDSVQIITERTPFYGESGGQAGDVGVIEGPNGTVEVTDTKKPFGAIVSHFCTVKKGTIKVDDEVTVSTDKAVRLKTANNHSATHLLHAALRNVLGDHVRQAGSSVNDKRLRFDFNHFSSLTSEEIKTIETEANKAVLADIEIDSKELPYDDAISAGALAFFGDKYGDMVRMVKMDDASVELCGGTHALRTLDIATTEKTTDKDIKNGAEILNKIHQYETILSGLTTLLKSTQKDLIQKVLKLAGKTEKDIAAGKMCDINIGLIKVTSESSVASGVRRIEAVTGSESLTVINNLYKTIATLKELFGVDAKDIITKTQELIAGQKEAGKSKSTVSMEDVKDAIENAAEISGITLILKELQNIGPKDLRAFTDSIKSLKTEKTITVVASGTDDGKVSIICTVTKDLTEKIKAGDIVKEIAPIVGGSGGGKPDMAQAGGKDPEKIQGALTKVRSYIESSLK